MSGGNISTRLWTIAWAVLVVGVVGFALFAPVDPPKFPQATTLSPASPEHNAGEPDSSDSWIAEARQPSQTDPGPAAGDEAAELPDDTPPELSPDYEQLLDEVAAKGLIAPLEPE